MRAVPEQIRPWVPNTYVTLGTDGFGFSDTRPAARRYFNTDAESIVVAVLEALARDGEIDPSVAIAAAKEYQIDDVMAAPVQTSDPGPGAPDRTPSSRFPTKSGVRFRGDRQRLLGARAPLGRRARVAVASGEAVLRPAGHRGRARHGRAAAVLRRARGVATRQRPIAERARVSGLIALHRLCAASPISPAASTRSRSRSIPRPCAPFTRPSNSWPR